MTARPAMPDARPAPFVSTAEVSVPQADRVLFKLCKHYAIKVPVVFDEHRATVDFPYGVCRMLRMGDTLQLRCEADSAERLEQIQHVMDEHVGLMSRNRALVIAWERAA
ncbi:DUF2218 domain-containing protein [Burkholderia multivorans]|uniref:DUF2218 domain-containing protein n=1 Tax=Burkholderia multivorans TaxID=87883 RepID=UPI0012DCE40E|nr:DUF2218 domain-containing protein [Burkholderia multivorans]MBU9219776.1 DUF2218 domain-containing protein [Burkholderia multivorans]MBU9339691.1 DUF2218 domain-containing protein [Burkholderia multivorans]MBU9416555.1 DUF2218 domain-containing protein [Burkholderia multivorans]MBU9476301.1 DUF2218 domain-containing protein [Burkholderia multivorans]MCA8139728.1 DUF2218 domain-containing protein [Burkholderia multivorans]